MRITDLTRFPHPVLSEDTGDYIDGKFLVNKFAVRESGDSSEVTFEYEFEITEESIEELLKNGQARLGLFVVCLRTYYNHFHSIDADKKNGTVQFKKGELFGQVIFRPVVCAVKSIDNFSAPDLHTEFGNISWNFKPSDVLALGPELWGYVGLDKLSPLITIFQLERNNEAPNGETLVKLENDKIRICANGETFDGIHRLKNTETGRLALLNGVYFPAVMEVLVALAEEGGGGRYAEYRWCNVFLGHCRLLNIEPDTDTAHRDAQTLLRSPLGVLLDSREYRV